MSQHARKQPGQDAQTAAMAVQWVDIDAELEGQRIDNFLVTRLKGVPRSLIYRILRRGEVRVNRGRIKPSYRLQAGDQVRIPPLRVSETEEPVRPGRQTVNAVEAGILYEDAGLLVLNKPSGLAVHGGSGVNYGVIEALRAMRPDAPFLELVHRLDRETSGCLIIAKKRSHLRRLHAMLRPEGEEGMEKYYLALVRGRWQGGTRTIDAPLRKNTLRSGERMVCVASDGKPSQSVFTPLVRYADATLMQVRLLTGRTHQARVHAAHAGHPIAGDEKYGDETFNRTMAVRGLARLFLHAERLRFAHPGSGEPLEVSAPLESRLQAVLARLEKLDKP